MADGIDSIAAAVEARRVALGWSAREVARRAGVSAPTVSRWLSGSRTLNSAIAAQVLEAVGLEVRESAGQIDDAKRAKR